MFLSRKGCIQSQPGRGGRTKTAGKRECTAAPPSSAETYCSQQRNQPHLGYTTRDRAERLFLSSTPDSSIHLLSTSIQSPKRLCPRSEGIASRPTTAARSQRGCTLSMREESPIHHGRAWNSHQRSREFPGLSACSWSSFPRRCFLEAPRRRDARHRPGMTKQNIRVVRVVNIVPEVWEGWGEGLSTAASLERFVQRLDVRSRRWTFSYGTRNQQNKRHMRCTLGLEPNEDDGGGDATCTVENRLAAKLCCVNEAEGGYL